jgi:ubiquinone/menaquinone biosynthesis C-methylase UbiE
MNFDGIAPWYRTFEYLAFGRSLETARLQFVDQVQEEHRALILGDGDGRFTAEFMKRNPLALVDSVDSSARMIEMAKRRVEAAGVLFVVGDARTVNVEGSYDLVATHFFLDCFSQQECEELVAKVAEHCAPDARWLLSEFQIPDRGLARLAAGALVRLMYFFFRVVTGLATTQLPDYRAALRRNGFQIAQSRRLLGGLVFAEMWQKSAIHS